MNNTFTIPADELRNMTYFTLGVLKGAEHVGDSSDLEEEWMRWSDDVVINIYYDEDYNLIASAYPQTRDRIDGTRWVRLDLDAARNGTL